MTRSPTLPWLEAYSVPAFTPLAEDAPLAVMFDTRMVPFLVEGDRTAYEMDVLAASLVVLRAGPDDEGGNP